jgi:hypothetical protein
MSQFIQGKRKYESNLRTFKIPIMYHILKFDWYPLLRTFCLIIGLLSLNLGYAIFEALNCVTSEGLLSLVFAQFASSHQQTIRSSNTVPPSKANKRYQARPQAFKAAYVGFRCVINQHCLCSLRQSQIKQQYQRDTKAGCWNQEATGELICFRFS